MTLRAGALLLLLLLAGCASPAAPLSVSGVAPASDGRLNLTAGAGLLVTPSPDNHTLAIGLAPVAQTSVLQACAGACRNLTVGAGSVIADRDLVALANVTLVAQGATQDPTINFYGPDLADLHVLRWSQATRAFQMQGDVLALGNLTATRFLSTRTLLVTPAGTAFTVSTAPTEGTEVTIFARGSATLENGTATVALPAPFQALEGAGPMTVQVTATGEGPALYVGQKAADHFVVRAAGGAGGNVPFDWFVQAPRKGADGFEV
jgi:hypothetical protein